MTNIKGIQFEYMSQVCLKRDMGAVRKEIAFLDLTGVWFFLAQSPVMTRL